MEHIGENSQKVSVLHARENGEDVYFQSKMYPTLLNASFRVMFYDLKLLTIRPNQLQEAFQQTETITPRYFESVKQDIFSDNNVRAVLEIDLDNRLVGMCDRENPSWRIYALEHLTDATQQILKRGSGSDKQNRQIFEESLKGLEISEDEIEQWKNEKLDSCEEKTMGMQEGM